MSDNDTTHECPAPTCTRRVPFEQFACSAHWYALPQNLRGELWRAWRSGSAAEHQRVREKCVRWLEELNPA